MKRLPTKRFRQAMAAGLPGIRSRVNKTGSNAAEKRQKEGYCDGWFFLRIENHGGIESYVMAPGAVGNFAVGNSKDVTRHAYTYSFPASPMEEESLEIKTYSYSYEACPLESADGPGKSHGIPSSPFGIGTLWSTETHFDCEGRVTRSTMTFTYSSQDGDF